MAQPVNIHTRLPVADASSITHNDSHGGGNGGGNDMLEARVAKLEADVENIKVNLAEARSDIRDLKTITAGTNKDVGVVLQKLVDIDEKLSNKAGKDFVDSKVGGIKIWMLGILLLSVAMPIISFLANLYIKTQQS
ncbi:hypothetical protein [Serratia marcescens]|uniref:hypothetical protein n=1 Tax=Serratia marcescens TaxID=615 RepID=UPI001EFA18D6|nr:hypothetical protein [Serratia marcescens]